MSIHDDCPNSKIIEMVNHRLDRIDSNQDKILEKIDTLMEFKNKQTGAIKVLYLVALGLGSLVTYVADRISLK